MTIQDINIPDWWMETTLGEISDNIAYGYTESASLEEIWPKFLRITDIQDDFIDWKTVPYCPISEKDLWKYKLWIGDIVIARTGNSTGATATIKEEVNAVFASYLIRFRLNRTRANYDFVDFLLRSEIWKGFVKSVKWGSAQWWANAKNFATFPILLPPLPEQQSIARMLSSFDNKVELLRAQNETLEKTAQMIFQEWFGKYGVEDELPEGWRVGKLGTEFDITIWRTPPRIEPEWFSENPTGKKWISIKDIGNSKTYIFETSEYLTDEAVKKFNIPIIPINTTILSFKMTVGKLTITTEEMLSNEAIAHLKIKDNSILSTEFIYCYLQKLDFNSLWSTSSIVIAINSTMIKELEVLVPSIERVKEFDKYIKPVFQKIHNNLSQIEMLSKTRDELLPRLMSGEILLNNKNK